MAKRPLENREEVEVRSRAELRAWLGANHRRTAGVWLVHHKKASPHYLPMGEIVEECLAWGWVDSLVRGKDALRAMHWIAPRKPGSNWSRVNKEAIARLDAAGALAPPGRAAVEAAKADGSWERLDAVERLDVPPDLADALAANGCRSVWDGFARSARRGILEWILNAKRPETRAKRIAETAAMAKDGKPANQWR
ncbi:MAG: YdeI/OmpD-associated family protein [Paracoccaceae bacterium]|nr:YdeI/OmpD-associated family protein [Paracoccaceae bacterium]